MNVVLGVVLVRLVLESLQLPVVVVVQVVAPPGLKLPATVALATPAPEFTSRTLTVAKACQLRRDNLAEPTRLLTAMVFGTTAPGAPLAKENASRLGDPVPTEVNRLALALVSKKETTAAGVAKGLACKAKAATPATWGEAMEVPLMVLVAVLLVIQAEVMLEPGAKTSTQLPKFE